MKKINIRFNMFLIHIIFVCLMFITVTFGSDPTAVTQNGCIYTFLMPKQDDSSCPVWSVASGPNIGDDDYLKSLVSLLTQNVQNLQQKVEALEGSQDRDKVGTNYVRWGRTECPQTAQRLYTGYAAKSYYTNTGGGVNYLCLHNQPEWPDVTTSAFEVGDKIYGVEYQTLTGLDSSLEQNDAPCAVCHVDGRGEHLMIPGQRSCPQNWTKEYEGLLVSDHHGHKKATYVCLDGDPEIIPGGSANVNGGLFYTAQAACGSLPCPPYSNGYEIACVVCTH